MKKRSFSIAAIAASIMFCYPADAKVTATQEYPSQITLTWDKNDQASGYRICRRDSGEWCVLADILDETKYADISAEEGITYTYSIRPFKINDRQVYWMDDEMAKGTILPPMPKNIKASPGEKGGDITLSWDLENDATGNNLLYTVSYFEIYVKKAGDLTWKFLASTQGQPNKKETQYVLDNTEAGDWYTVRSAYCTSSGETVYSDYDELGIEGGIPVGATSRIYNAISNGTKGNQIDWISLSSSAEKLEVLRKTQPDGSFKVVKTVTDPDEIRHGSYIDTDTTITESYFYTVRAYLNQSGMAVGGWYEQDGVEIQALPNMPTMLTASYLASDTPCIQIGWDINENTKDSCDGYYIYRRDSQDSDWQLMGTNAGENNNLFMDASIEKGSTYEYVVRAYKEDSTGSAVESASPEVVRAVVPK